MTEQKSQIPEVNAAAFPFPKFIQSFNYLFPKEEKAADIFTMENFRKLARFAPYLTLVLLSIIFAAFIRDVEKTEECRYAIYMVTDVGIFIVILLQYLWWLGVSIFAKLVRRSPVIPLAMSFLDPLRFFAGLCVLHFLGFIIGQLMSLSS